MLYASAPFWSALLASQLFRTETLGQETWIGGALIVAGTVLSSIDDEKERDVA